MARSNGRCRSCKHRRNRSTRSTHGPRQHGPTCASPRTSSPPTAISPPGDALFRLPGAKKPPAPLGSPPGHSVRRERQGAGSGGTPFRSPSAPSTPAPPIVSCVLFSVGSLQASLRLPPSKRTCIRRAPPPARVRGWTRPPEPVPARSARRRPFPVLPDLSS